MQFFSEKVAKYDNAPATLRRLFSVTFDLARPFNSSRR
jgi:hypothetical protein